MLLLLLIIILLPPPATAQCIPPPGSCPRRHEQFICHVEGLWLVNGQFYALDLQSFPLPYTLTEHHTGSSITIHRAPHVLHATEIWKGG